MGIGFKKCFFFMVLMIVNTWGGIMEVKYVKAVTKPFLMPYLMLIYY